MERFCLLQKCEFFLINFAPTRLSNLRSENIGRDINEALNGSSGKKTHILFNKVCQLMRGGGRQNERRREVERESDKEILLRV